MVAAPAAAATIVVSDSSRCGAAAFLGRELLSRLCPCAVWSSYAMMASIGGSALVEHCRLWMRLLSPTLNPLPQVVTMLMQEPCSVLENLLL